MKKPLILIITLSGVAAPLQSSLVDCPPSYEKSMESVKKILNIVGFLGASAVALNRVGAGKSPLLSVDLSYAAGAVAAYFLLKKVAGAVLRNQWKSYLFNRDCTVADLIESCERGAPLDIVLSYYHDYCPPSLGEEGSHAVLLKRYVTHGKEPYSPQLSELLRNVLLSADSQVSFEEKRTLSEAIQFWRLTPELRQQFLLSDLLSPVLYDRLLSGAESATLETARKGAIAALSDEERDAIEYGIQSLDATSYAPVLAAHFSRYATRPGFAECFERYSRAERMFYINVFLKQVLRDGPTHQTFFGLVELLAGIELTIAEYQPFIPLCHAIWYRVIASPEEAFSVLVRANSIELAVFMMCAHSQMLDCAVRDLAKKAQRDGISVVPSLFLEEVDRHVHYGSNATAIFILVFAFFETIVRVFAKVTSALIGKIAWACSSAQTVREFCIKSDEPRLQIALQRYDELRIQFPEEF